VAKSVDQIEEDGKRSNEVNRAPVIGGSMGRVRGKNGFGNHHVNAFVAIDKFGDVQVGGNTGQHVGVVAREVLLVHQEVDHFADGEFCGFVEIFVKAHGNEMSRGFRARPMQMHVFADNKLKGTDEGGFEGGNVDFAVALAGVTVTDLK
jgi:hypothetical protein